MMHLEVWLVLVFVVGGMLYVLSRRTKGPPTAKPGVVTGKPEHTFPPGAFREYVAQYEKRYLAHLIWKEARRLGL